MKRPQPSAGFLAIGVAAVLGGVLWVLISRSPHREPSPAIRVLAISPTGEWMASGGTAGKVHLWKTEAPELATDIAASNGTLNDLQFSGKEVLAIADKDIRLVNVKNPAQFREVRSDGANYGTVRFSADSKTLLTVNGKSEILAIDLATSAARRIYCCTSIYGEVAFTADGTEVAWAGHWPGILDLRSGAVTGRLARDRELMTLGPIASDQNGAIYMGSQDGHVYQWNVRTRMRIGESPAQVGYVRTIAVLGETGWIAYAGEDGPVHLWHPATGRSQIIEAAHTTSNMVFDVTHNRTSFGTATGEIQFWDLLEGRMLATLPRVH